MRFDYPAGVLPEERPVVERFEDLVVPYVESHGSEIGEAAMTGNRNAEEIIRRYDLFIKGMPEMRPLNLTLCIAALKRYERMKVN